MRNDAAGVPEAGRALSLRVVEVVEAIEEVDDIREVGVGLPIGRAAGVLDGGLPREGLGDADGDASAEELVEVTLDAGRALSRRFTLGVEGGGDIKLERADEEATDDGRETNLVYRLTHGEYQHS